MRSASLLKPSSLLLSLLRLVSAQSIVPTSSSSQFPSCALSCTVLLQAQTACVPPVVPATNQITYENCFCQSSFLQALYSTPDAICTAECTSESDRALLQSWFTNFCQEVGRGIDPLVTTASTLQPTSTTVVTITSYSTPPPAATSTGTGSASGSAPPSHQSWIDGHWRWILMIGVLAVGFGLLTWLAIWFKRRHNRKIEERRAAASGFPTADEQRGGARSATPDLWGPHQHMHYTKGWEYHNDPAILGGTLLASSSSRRDRKSKRTSSSQRNHRDPPEMAELGGGRPPTSRRDSSSKGKARATDEIMPVGSETRTADRSRSRSQRRRDMDSDPERSQVDSEHQRRLREVRGSRRKKDADQI